MDVYRVMVERVADTQSGVPVQTQADLQAALNDGGTISVGPEPIELTGPLEVTVPGTRVLGGRFVCPDGPAFVGAVSDVELAGQTILGGRGSADSYSADQKLIWFQGSETAPLSGVVVRDCRMSGSRGSNVWLEWCRDSHVSGITAREFLYAGVMVISGDGVRVSNNTITDAPLSPGVVNPYGVAFTDYDGTDTARSRRCSAVGNTIRLIDWEGIDTHGGDQILITGNTVVGCPRGIALVVGNETRSTAPTRGLVTDNVIDGTGMRQPMREAVILGGIAGAPADALIENNRFLGYKNPVYLDYVDRALSTIGGNNVPLVPWTPITMDGDYTANSTYRPEFMIDGHTVVLRGAAIPKPGTPRTVIGRIPSIYARPTTLTMVALTQGSNPTAGRGMVGVDADGTLRLWYGTGSDTYSYWLTGSYRAA